jgi:HK97 family phage portal protein
MGLFSRSARPPDIPNSNDPADVPPATVGPPSARPGDPNGVVITGTDVGWSPPSITPSAWSGWPADWNTPNWSGGMMMPTPTDTAWMVIDRQASILSTMPAYLKGAAPSTPVGWLTNPDANMYTSWEEFCKQLFWDYQAVGEAFVLATAWYATGWPASFHVVPPWWVNITMADGLRTYEIGGDDVTGELLHIRYSSQVGVAHGIGPLEAGGNRVAAAQALISYATKLVGGGGIPSGVLEHPAEQTPAQAAALKADWVAARLSSIGEPAVLSGGIKWTPTQINPNDLGLTTLLDREEGRIAQLLGMPSELVGIPTSTDPMTYKNMNMWTELHWRQGLEPKAVSVMKALSGWALPRGTSVELDSRRYVAPMPLEQAQVIQIYSAIVDPVTGQPALTVQEIREQLGVTDTTRSDTGSGVLQ